MEKKKKIALVLPGGFMTGIALQTGLLKAFHETKLLDQVTFISGTSAGALAGVMAATGRVPELEVFLRELRPQDVFRRRSLISLSLSHLAVAIAATLERMERRTVIAKPFSKPFRKFLRNPNLHIDAFNDFVIEETIRKKFDLQALSRDLQLSPIEFVAIVTSLTTPGFKAFSSRSTSSDVLEQAIFASASPPVFSPVRRVGDDIFTDGGVLKPDPLSLTYDADCDLIVAFATLGPDFKKKKIITILDVIEMVMLVDQYERRVRERKIADEKTKDVETLHALKENVKRAIEHLVDEPELKARLIRALNDAVRSAHFSFRHDLPIKRIDIMPSWEPSIEVSLYGGYGDFSLIPQIIERGYRETMRVLKHEKLI